jgi:hypothetical protein
MDGFHGCEGYTPARGLNSTTPVELRDLETFDFFVIFVLEF